MESGAGPSTTPVRNPNLIGFCIEGQWFWVAEGLLTEVAPPLPEPPDGSAVAVGSSVFQRSDVEAEPGDEDHHWFAAGRQFLQFGTRWAALCDGPEPPVLLVPDPFAVPVELPWELPVYGATLVVAVHGAGVNLSYDSGTVHLHRGALNPGQARTTATALWTAADEAERAS